MKKMLAATLLTLTLTVSTYAGDVPFPGGYSCPTGRICTVNPDGTVTVSSMAPEEELSFSAWLYAMIFGA